MPKEIKDMTIPELIDEFESSVVKAEKYVYAGFHKEGNEARTRARMLRETLLGQIDSLKKELNVANRRLMIGVPVGE